MGGSDQALSVLDQQPGDLLTSDDRPGRISVARRKPHAPSESASYHCRRGMCSGI